MWRCSNCGTGIEDKYAHCWQCGAPNVVRQRTQTPQQTLVVEPEQKSVPGFASYEELAHVPSRPIWFFRRGLLQRGFWFLLAIIIIKVGASQFLGKYGVYIVSGVAVIALIMILWSFFRRDPNEGVGIKLD
jgi:DNA-directed RNA polymerase subunit RPC12/RpoP